MDKLTENLKRLNDLAFGTTKCPTCNRLITEEDNIRFVQEYGMCIMCDSIKHDADEQLYREINKEVNEDGKNRN